MDIDKIRQEKSVQELLEFSIINLDKPAGPTSFKTGQKIKYLLGLKKTSHFGTLDPMVTGVLPIGLNRACKLSDFFMHRDKVYIGEMRLHKKISQAELEKEMKKFIGVIKQKPPVKSRVKRVERERKVNRFEILGFKGQRVEFLADVEAGTYIRKLIHDLGEIIGGAHMIGLRRIRAGLFEEKEIISIEEIEKAVEEWKNGNESLLRKILIPAEIISKLYPVVQVKKTRLEKIFNGRPLMEKDLGTGLKGAGLKIIEGLEDKGIFVVFCGERFIGVYKKTDEKEFIGRGLFVKS